MALHLRRFQYAVERFLRQYGPTPSITFRIEPPLESKYDTPILALVK